MRTAAAPAGFGAPVNLQLRTGSSRPSVRGAIHRSGRIYITFVRATAGGSDIVVMRDDAWGGNGFGDLADPGDGIAGIRVVSGVTVPPVGTLLGTQRVSSRIAIAVDPRSRRRVYLAWCDGAVTAMSPFTLHLRRSDDGGANWTGDLRTILNVTNPCLAVNVQGVVALMYQQLVTVAGTNRWNTVLKRSTNRFATVATTSVLANTPPAVGFGAAGDLGDFRLGELAVRVPEQSCRDPHLLHELGRRQSQRRERSFRHIERYGWHGVSGIRIPR